MERLTMQKLESTLWKAADILRGELNAAQYMDYIFGLLFLKRMNDEFEIERNEKREEFIAMGLPEGEVTSLIEDPSIYLLHRGTWWKS
ncbi:type I restriction-modification system subunit M N-terminal domain-containing protein [Clostridium algidicarnis]|uniref:type I restriction-modification system subunit M N-terminal domain-containing protein n=1 Tax=Clostridium algidicarnis TaxID=37659 RepID=UPI001FABB8BC|nr:type I restriction-modification system subunit M N-terminal domain-containing protein [Clostridium algidicarnis]